MTEAVWRYWVHKIQQGDRDTERKAVLELESLLVAIVKSWRFPGAEFDELLQEARISALEALRSYDESYSLLRGGEQATVRHYVRRVVSNRLAKIKSAAITRHDCLDSDSDVEETVTREKPVQGLDVSLIRMVFPYLTSAERRGVIAMLEESGPSVVAGNTAVTKQAVSRGWRSALRLISQVNECGPRVLEGKRLIGSQPDDWRLEEVLQR